MKSQIRHLTGDLAELSHEAVAILVAQGTVTRHAAVRSFDKALDGALLKHVKHVEFDGKKDQVVDVPTLGRTKARRIVLVGLGTERDISTARVRDVVAATVRNLQAGGAKTVGLIVGDASSDVRVLGEAIGLGAYRFSRYLTGDRRPKSSLAAVDVLTDATPSAAQKRDLALGLEIAEAVCLARDAVNEPPNELYPEVLAQRARAVAKRHGLKIKVLDKKGILAAKMFLHYAVGQGSSNDPRFVHLTYSPRRKATKRLVFVGKGLTFDSGGLCIKPAPGMGEMKSDMAGAAAVLGLMSAVGIVKPDVEVHGIIGAAENMPDGAAYRPGDVFGSLNGKTVEIINTDAEGRLVLADALAYATKLKPDLLIDAATLTGACLVALGKTCSGFYATKDDLAKELAEAARHAGESFWRLPLLEELADELKSDVADLKHTGERWGGSISAALFLREFTAGLPWIHCDIAGPVLADRARGAYPKGGTGHAVLTFLRLVESA